jgi:hypothetical protein
VTLEKPFKVEQLLSDIRRKTLRKCKTVTGLSVRKKCISLDINGTLSFAGLEGNMCIAVFETFQEIPNNLLTRLGE